MKKQDLLDQMEAEQLQDEEIMGILNKYPDEMSSEDADRLEQELEDSAADNELLAKAYAELDSDIGDQMDMVESEMDAAITKTAKNAYEDLSWAMEKAQE